MICFSIPFKSDASTFHRDELLTKCLRQLDSLQDRRFAVIVAYWSSEVFDWDVIRQLDYEVTGIDCPLPFSIWQAHILASQCTPDDAIFHPLDGDMCIQEGYIEHVHGLVSEGVVFSPICYSLNQGKPPEIHGNRKNSPKANGWWRETGKGNNALLKTDWDRLNLSGVKDTRWGQWDNELHRRMKKAKLKIVRKGCGYLFHLWHPNSPEYKNRHF